MLTLTPGVTDSAWLRLGPVMFSWSSNPITTFLFCPMWHLAHSYVSGSCISLALSLWVCPKYNHLCIYVLMLGSHYRDYFPSFHQIIYCSYFIILTRTCISKLCLTFWVVIVVKSAVFAVLFLCTITFNAKIGLRVESRCGGSQECWGLRHSPYLCGMGRSHAPPGSPVLCVNQGLSWVTGGLPALISHSVVPLTAPSPGRLLCRIEHFSQAQWTFPSYSLCLDIEDRLCRLSL